jgi:ankyrin repeat protein
VFLFNRTLVDDAMEMLLQAGARVDQPSEAGRSLPEPLHLAAMYGTVKAVRLMLDAGAPPNVRSSVFGSPRLTPLHTLAALECRDAPEKVRLLVAAARALRLSLTKGCRHLPSRQPQAPRVSSTPSYNWAPTSDRS